MPTGTCKYPQHHKGQSAGGPVTLVLALLAGAGIIAYAHQVIIVLAVVLVVGIVAAGVVMLIHSSHAAPYDLAYSESEPRQLPELSNGPIVAQVVHVHAEPVAGRTAEIEAMAAELSLLRSQVAGQIAAPAQHLHLHGLTAEDIASVLAGAGMPLEVPVHGAQRRVDEQRRALPTSGANRPQISD